MITPEFIDGIPPAAMLGKPHWAKGLIDVLKSRPGEWAIVPITLGVSLAAHKQRAYYLRRLGCEANTRAGVVYARWPVTEVAK